MQQAQETKINTIRPIVRGLEQIQKLRIQTGNRIAANFMRRNKMEEGEVNSAEDFEKLQKKYNKVLDDLRKEYIRITDAIVNGDADAAVGRLPRPNKFVPTPLINSYSELVLMDQYMRLLDTEEVNNKQLANTLGDYDLYTKYLKDVPGIGPKLAAVIISELDPYKAKYVTSYWNYAGLDTVIIGVYTDKKGKEQRLGWREIVAYYADADVNEPIVIDGSVVKFETVGRSRKAECQVNYQYEDKEGKQQIRSGISFNPFLKTKLIGVAGPAFLKTSVTYMDGERISKDERLTKAKSMGFKSDKPNPDAATYKAADAFLNANGVKVWTQYSRFGEIYYSYRRRLEQSTKPEHQGLSAIQIHNRAIRYMVKEFLRELYIVSRHLEGLPIHQSYEQAKLGYVHERNQFLYETFGIDTTKFLPNQKIAEAESFYPKAIQDYINQRSTPCMVMV